MTVGGSDSFDILRAVQAGCVVVTQDVRGRYSSDGEFEPNVNETSDGVDTIAWAAAQPWAAGVVGTFGGSYLGGTQWLPARQSPPALKAMAPSVTFSDMHEGCCFAESRPIRFSGLAIRGIGVSKLPLDQGADRYHAVDGAAPSSCCSAPNRVFRWESATTCTQA
jgi:putative CocE/NonD family hydrolase